VRFVGEANEAMGRSASDREAPWDIVCEKMGGSRTRTQCRQKWLVFYFPLSHENHTDMENQARRALADQAE